MAELVSWQRHELDAPSLMLATPLAQLHQRFTQIHPFDDANGRVVRL
jgi:Fic family protein